MMSFILGIPTFRFGTRVSVGGMAFVCISMTTMILELVVSW